MRAGGSGTLRRADPAEEGAILVLSVLCLAGMLLVASLAIDLGNARQRSLGAKQAADLAALTGAQLMGEGDPGSTVAAAVKAYATQNIGVPPSAWANCVDPGHLAVLVDVAANDQCISENAAGSLLRVTLPPEALQTALAKIDGPTAIAIDATSEAAVQEEGPCAVCVLGTGSVPPFEVEGTGAVLVSNPAAGGPGITVDGSGPSGVLTGRAAIGAAPGDPPARVTFQAGATVSSSASINGVGACSAAADCTAEAPPTPDPLAFLPVPAVDQVGSCPGSVVSDSPPECTFAGHQAVTLSPGVYGSISLSGGATVTLAPGVYVLTGTAGLSLAGTGALVGTGVTIYATCPSSVAPFYQPCASGQSGAGLDLAGGAAVDLSPPTTGPYQGLTLFADRHNVAAVEVSGTASLGSGSGLAGTIYAASGTLEVEGTAPVDLSSLVDVGALSDVGNASLDVTVDASANVPVPPVPHLVAAVPSTGG